MPLSTKDADQVIRSTYDESNDALQVNIVAGSISVSDLDVITTINVDAASIPDNASSTFEVVASLSADVKQIQLYETTGKRLQLRVGSSNGTLKLLIGPGQDNIIPCSLSSGDRISIRSDESTAPSSGSVILTFLG